MLSCVHLFETQWTAAHQASLSFTIFCSLLKFMSIESVMASHHLILCYSLFLLLQSFPASGSLPMSQLCIRWPKYWSFSFSISPSSEYSGLISFRIDYPKDSQEFSPAPQFESISSLTLSFLYKSTLLHPYMTTGKTIALTRQTFVGKMMSLFSNMLSRIVIAFL